MTIKEKKVMNLETKKILMKECSAMDLESVGTTITSELMLFPTNEDGTFDTTSGTHLYDCDDEWFTSLSEDDLIDLFKFVELKGDVVKVVFNEWKLDICKKWENVNKIPMLFEVI
jgi:hypothetical protein